jgi:predicted nucleic acid-binding protein
MFPLRLVLDTNVVVSAALKPESLQRTTLLLATSKPVHLYVSLPLLEEYEEVLSRLELGIRRAEAPTDAMDPKQRSSRSPHL